MRLSESHPFQLRSPPIYPDGFIQRVPYGHTRNKSRASLPFSTPISSPSFSHLTSLSPSRPLSNAHPRTPNARLPSPSTNARPRSPDARQRSPDPKRLRPRRVPRPLDTPHQGAWARAERCERAVFGEGGSFLGLSCSSLCLFALRSLSFYFLSLSFLQSVPCSPPTYRQTRNANANSIKLNKLDETKGPNGPHKLLSRLPRGGPLSLFWEE